MSHPCGAAAVWFFDLILGAKNKNAVQLLMIAQRLFYTRMPQRSARLLTV